MTNTYNKGEVKFYKDKNNLKHDIILSWHHGGVKKTTDFFNFKITYNNKSTYFDFYNSIMETELNQKILSHYSIRTKDLLPKWWAGYDDCKTLSELNRKRVYYLVYSALNCYFNDINTEVTDFDWFCDNLGLDNDSISSFKTYSAIMDKIKEARSIGLFDEINFIRTIASEEKGTDETIKEALRLSQ